MIKAHQYIRAIGQGHEPIYSEAYADNPVAQYLTPEDRDQVAFIDSALAHEGPEEQSRATLLLYSMTLLNLTTYQLEKGESVDLTKARQTMASLHEAAVRGLASAAYSLGNFYVGGDAGFIDERAAEHWFRFAIQTIEQGLAVDDFEHMHVQDDGRAKTALLRQCRTNLGGLFQFGSQTPRDYDQALTLYRQAAAEDEPVAQWNVYAMLTNGQGCEPDPVNVSEALRNLESAAKAGMGQAAETYTDYMQACEQGPGVANAWIYHAFWQGHPWARWALIRAYIDPTSQAFNPHEAAHMLFHLQEDRDLESILLLLPDLLACQCDEPAIARDARNFVEINLRETPALRPVLEHYMIIALLEGQGGPCDVERAKALLVETIERGEDHAFNYAEKLGILGDVFAGVYREQDFDETKALHYYRASAEKGCAASMFDMGWAYEEGLLGLEPDVDEAFGWYARGREAGDERSRLQWAGMIVLGDVEADTEDLEEAIDCVHEAAAEGDELWQEILGEEFGASLL